VADVKLTIDSPRCNGCRICEVFCSFHHEQAVQPSRARVQVAPGEEAGFWTVIACRQCARAKCAAACPRGAIERDTAGIWRVDAGRCDGCGLCVPACPYHAMRLDGERHLAFKCDLCNGEPQCAKMCPTGAIRCKEVTE
jgi:anaerobic carbon-monoxide dehydrogenase iron sulfur subunit